MAWAGEDDQQPTIISTNQTSSFFSDSINKVCESNQGLNSVKTSKSESAHFRIGLTTEDDAED